MSSWKQQALIEAPVEEVWSLLSDPSRYADYAEDVIQVTGVPTRVEKGSTFEMTNRGPLGTKATTTFKVEEFDDLREIKLRCQTSGFYSHWTLAQARGNTFADLELGVERSKGLQGRATAAMLTKRYLRRMADRAVDGVRRVLGRK